MPDSATLPAWRVYITDSVLVALIDIALVNNQEYKIVQQELQINAMEVKRRKAEYKPFVSLLGGIGTEKQGEYTRNGALEKQLKVKEHEPFPEPLNDFRMEMSAQWELDIWQRLRNQKRAAVNRYLASQEGRNFMLTNLIAEISEAYYRLLMLDNLFITIEENIELQRGALKTIIQEKEAAKVTQLAVNRFEAQLLNTENRAYLIKQSIVEAENRLNLLVGRLPTVIIRRSTALFEESNVALSSGIPSGLLIQRPDIRQSEFELMASKLDVKAARARFYPSITLRAGIGYQAFNSRYLLNPQSLLYHSIGDLAAPLINRAAIKAEYGMAKAAQLQALYRYEQRVMNAFVEVINNLNKIDNYGKALLKKEQEVKVLSQSVSVANNLFVAARADYLEVLLTQREALEARLELIELRSEWLNSRIGLYRSLGGGWK